MPNRKEHHKDEGYLREGILLQFETVDLDTAKTRTEERDGQQIWIPTEGVRINPDHKILLKFRHHSRCMFCFAEVIDLEEERMLLLLPNFYESMNRAFFQRCDTNLPAKLNNEEVKVVDISVAGAAVETQSPLEEGKRYGFTLGRFKTFATVREVRDGGWIRIQFPLRDNLSYHLNNIVRKAQQARNRLYGRHKKFVNA